MKQIIPRTYQVGSADFPIAVTIRARNLDECVAIVGDVHVMKNGEEAERIPVDVSSGEALTESYEIEKPSVKQPCDLVQVVLGWFGKKPQDSARYEITIEGAAGDEFETTVRVPSIDPGVANLTFQSR